MKQLSLFFFFLASICQAQTPALNDHTVCFYYNWYGSNSIDGNNYHWAHPVMPQNDKDTTKKFFPGNGDIGANFYPSNGEYSSADPALIEKHMQEIESAGIGIIAVTWLGENDYTYKSVTPLFDAASRHGIKVCFQIEPIVRKTVFSTCDALDSLSTSLEIILPSTKAKYQIARCSLCTIVMLSRLKNGRSY